MLRQFRNTRGCRAMRALVGMTAVAGEVGRQATAAASAVGCQAAGQAPARQASNGATTADWQLTAKASAVGRRQTDGGNGNRDWLAGN